MNPTQAQMTHWKQLVKLESRLGQLLAEIQTIQDDPARPSFCANRIWYGVVGELSFKDRLCYLVGWDRRGRGPAALATEEAYDTCYDVLYAALPDYRNCQCFPNYILAAARAGEK